MRFLNNNVESKSSIKYVLSNKILPRITTILFSLTIIALLTINMLIKKNMIIALKSTPKETVKSIHIKINSKLDSIKSSLSNDNELPIQTVNINENMLDFIDNTQTSEYIKVILSPRFPKEIWNNTFNSINYDNTDYALNLDNKKNSKVHNNFNYYDSLKNFTKNISLKKNVSLTPVYLFNKQLPFYKKVNAEQSPVLSFMSTLEIFYSINILIVFLIIILALIISLLYKPLTSLLSALDVIGIFTKNKNRINLNDELDMSSDDKITKNF